MGLKDIFGRRKHKYYGYGYVDYDSEKYWERQRVYDRNLRTDEENSKADNENERGTIVEKKQEERGFIEGKIGIGDREFKKIENIPAEQNTKLPAQNVEGKSIPKKEVNPFFIPIRKETKDVVIFVVENSLMINQYKNDIGKIISKIVNDNNKCLFLFLRVGNNKKYFDIMDYDKLIESKTLEELFVMCENEECNVDYLDVLKHVDSFLSSVVLDFEYNGKKYEIQSKSIIFFGTGAYNLSEQSESESRRLVRRTKVRKGVKNIKYFCINDSQTVNIASLGFPVIGHIVSDFYK